MPYRLTLATDGERALVVEAMRAAAGTRTRAAAKAATGTVADKRAGRDVRSRAVRLVELLAEAGDLERLATELEQARAVTLVEPVLRDSTGEAVDPDDVTPAQARAVAAAVEVEPTDPATSDEGPDRANPTLAAAEQRVAFADDLATAAGLEPTLLLEDGRELDPDDEDEPTDDDVVAVLEAGR